jgi:soluble P-type ATPase
MTKPGIKIEIPNFAPNFFVRRIVTDYTGTLSFGGRLIPGVEDCLKRLKELVEIDVITADSFGTARAQLAVVPLEPRILEPGSRHDREKKTYAEKHEPGQVAAFGNGNNDELLLKVVRKAGGLAVAVDNGEGCSVLALKNANIFIVGILNGLNLLLEPTRCKATLRK